MRRFIVMLGILCAGIQITSAQKQTGSPAGELDEASEARNEILLERKIQKNAGTEFVVSTADVGEPDSFGKNAKFLGVAESGVVYVYTSCDPVVLLEDLDLVLGPDDRCLAAPDPALGVNALFTNIARINIPARASSDVIYAIANHSINWNYLNDTANPIRGQVSYSPRVTIISDALNDPAAIDPVTGLPMNGQFTTTGFGTKFTTTLLEPTGFDSVIESYSRANTRGFARSYWQDIGLPDAVINRIYKSPMTIRLDARVAVRGVNFGQFVFTARFLGN